MASKMFLQMILWKLSDKKCECFTNLEENLVAVKTWRRSKWTMEELCKCRWIFEESFIFNFFLMYLTIWFQRIPHSSPDEYWKVCLFILNMTLKTSRKVKSKFRSCSCSWVFFYTLCHCGQVTIKTIAATNSSTSSWKSES